MPTRIFPSSYQPPAVPSLEELLAKVQAQTAMQAPTLMRPEGAVNGLSSMLAPYQGAGPMGMGQGPSFYQMAGMGNPLDILGGGGVPGGNIGLGSTPPGGGATSGYGGGTGPSYTGPPDPNMQQWENAVVNGRIPLKDMGRVPMNTGGLVDRLEGAKPWEDVDMKMRPGAERDFLMPEAAQSYRAMMRDAAQAGVPLVFGQSYRDLPGQLAAWNRYQAGQGAPAAEPIFGPGGVEGTSNHGWGQAVDLNLAASPGQRDWLLNNASDYGWYFPMDYEPWHLQYEGGYEGWSPDFKPSFRPGPGSSTGSGGPPASSAGSGSTGSPRRKAPSTPDPRQVRVMREGY